MSQEKISNKKTSPGVPGERLIFRIEKALLIILNDIKIKKEYFTLKFDMGKNVII